MEALLSYSHKDESLKKELEEHLSILRREDILHVWHDREISAGTELDGVIGARLQSANIIILLISPSFFASDYCYGVEMKAALARHEKREVRVIPIVARPVDWASSPLGKLLALPTDGRPVTSWGNRDEAWLDVARGIRKTIKEMRPPATTKFTPVAAPAVFSITPPQPPAQSSKVSAKNSPATHAEIFEWLHSFNGPNLTKAPALNRCESLVTEGITAAEFQAVRDLFAWLTSYAGPNLAKGQALERSLALVTAGATVETVPKLATHFQWLTSFTGPNLTKGAALARTETHFDLTR